MKRELPWIGQSPELISGRHHKRIGRARLLLDFYTHCQTDAQGRVYYGKPITYRWIAKRILECPCPRTLKRYNEQLRRNGYIVTKTVIRDGMAVGFTVALRNQAKFRTAPAAMAGQQIGLFNAPVPMPKLAAPRHSEAVQMPVEKAVNAPQGVVTKLSPGGDRSVPVKDLKKETGEAGNKQPPRWRAATVQNGEPPNKFDPARAWRQSQKARRILREIEVTRECYTGAYGADLLRRDQKLAWLYQELRSTGWQDARAG